MILHILIFLLLLGFGTAQEWVGIHNATRAIRIAALFTDPEQEKDNPNYTGLYQSQGQQMRDSLLFWENKVNEEGLLIGDEVWTVNLTLINIGYEDSVVIETTQRAVDGELGDFFLFIGPFSSGWTEIMAPIFENTTNVLMLAPLASASEIWECGTASEWESRKPCTEQNSRRFEKSWGLLPPAANFWDTTIFSLKLLGSESIAFWGSNDSFTSSVLTGISTSTDSAGLKDLTPNGGGRFTSPVDISDEEVAAMVSAMKNTNADILSFTPRRTQTCIPIINELYKQNVVAKAILVSQCVAEASVINATGDKLRYLFDYALWDYRLRGNDFQDDVFFQASGNETSAARFLREFQEYAPGKIPDTIAAPGAFVAGELIKSVLERTQSFDLNEIQKALLSTNVRTFYGRIVFNAFGMNEVKEVATVQRGLTNNLEVVLPLGSASIRFVYPFPTWEERIWDPHYLGYASEQAIFGIYGFAVLVTFLMAIIILIFKEKPTFKAAAPKILLLICVGILLLLSGVATWMLYMSTPMCYLRVWFLATGFTLVFGSIIAKTRRIYLLFKKTKLRVGGGYKDDVVFLQVLGMLAIEWIILIIWSAVERPVAITIIPDPYRPVNNYLDCTWGTMSWIMLALIGALNLIIALYALWLSLELWRFGSTMFGESRETIFSLYNMCLLVGVIIALEASLVEPGSRETLFVVRSLVILLGSVSIIMALIFPKFKNMEGHSMDVIVSKVVGRSSTSASASVSAPPSARSDGLQPAVARSDSGTTDTMN